MMASIKRVGVLAAAGMICVGLSATVAQADEFTYLPPGDLESSASGRIDQKAYVPDMRFPIEETPAFLNSQVHGHGGYLGPGGGQCDSANYSYPWRDNYCESRSWSVPLCPSGKGHQGQDIRPATCEKKRWWAVAAEAGKITSIGSYSVYLTASDGTRHRYLHLDMGSLAVSVGQSVQKGARLGKVSNDFGGTPTTIHLHYDIHQHVSGIGKTYVPTYMSLVNSYEALLGGAGSTVGCEPLPATGGVIDDVGPCFRLHGPPATWRYVQGAGEGGSLHWTKAWNGDHEANWAEWEVQLDAAGRFDVEINTASSYAQSQQARWAVRADGSETEVRVNHTEGYGWRSIGTYDFAAGGSQWVRMYDNTGEASSLDRRIMADAIRLIPHDGTTQPEPEPTPTPTPSLPPCTLARDGGVLDSAGDCLKLFGPTQWWRYVEPGGHGGSLYWTKAYAGSSRSNYAEFSFELEESGVYRIETYNPATYGTSQKARWEIDADGKTHVSRVNLGGKEGWIQLAEMTMRPGMQYVARLEDNTGERSSLGRRLPVDALRLTRVDDDNGVTVLTLPVTSSDSVGGDLAEGPESKGFLPEDPAGVPIPETAPHAELRADQGEIDGACACSTTRGKAPTWPSGLGLVLIVGLGLLRRRRRHR